MLTNPASGPAIDIEVCIGGCSASGRRLQANASIGRDGTGFGGRGFRAASGSVPPEAPLAGSTAAARSLEQVDQHDCAQVHRLLIRIRDPTTTGPDGLNGTGDNLRRRLTEDVSLPIKKWDHFYQVGIDVAELDCSEPNVDPLDVLHQIEARYGNALEFAELDQRVYAISQEDAKEKGTDEKKETDKGTENGATAPNDPSWPSLWGMSRIGVEDAWTRLGSTSDARTTIVAVIDTGVKLDHEDLRDMLWTNTGEILGNGIDDDGNGYIDDIHGYDFQNNDGDPSDDSGHGTHCAGVIAAAADNGVGVAGIGSRHANVKIMALKFLGPSGGSTSDAIRAIEYAIAMGAPISSNSWGGGGRSSAMQAALQAAENAGHIFIAAAGNDDTDNDVRPSWPCCYNVNNVVCVAATTSSDALASYSNYGPGCVQIAAPGSSIYSAYTSPLYRHLSGTSMATPHVAGAAALVYSAFSALGPAEVREMILASVEVTPWLRGKVSTSGLLDVDALIARAQGSLWLWLLPAGAEPSSRMTTTIQPGASETLSLRVGRANMRIGQYTKAVEVKSQGVSSWVNVSYTLDGWPRFEMSWVGTTLSLGWGGVPVIGHERLTATVRNVGNGTGRLQVGGVAAPFTVPDGVITVAPSESSSLEFVCAPTETGSWTAATTLRTNIGADPSLGSGGLDVGQYYIVQLDCTGTPSLPPTPSPTIGDSCTQATDLSTVTSPYQSSTSNALNTHGTSCGGRGNEKIFFIDVPVGLTLTIGMSSNSYDSRHETRWGGACPGTNTVACTDDPDTRQHRWTNSGGTAERAYFIVDAYSTGSGSFTLAWSTADEPDSCEQAMDLSTVSSPHHSTTTGALNTHGTSCGGYGNEKIFFIDLPASETLTIGMSSNSYDSRHETRWGGPCPGTNVVLCTDDPDTRQHTWTNTQGTTQRAYLKGSTLSANPNNIKKYEP